VAVQRGSHPKANICRRSDNRHIVRRRLINNLNRESEPHTFQIWNVNSCAPAQQITEALDGGVGRDSTQLCIVGFPEVVQEAKGFAQVRLAFHEEEQPVTMSNYVNLISGSSITTSQLSPGEEAFPKSGIRAEGWAGADNGPCVVLEEINEG
jgi:hypothetical protein